MEDFIPQTQPSGALVPPNKPPGTAIATSAAGDTSEFGACVAISDEIFRNGLQ